MDNTLVEKWLNYSNQYNQLENQLETTLKQHLNISLNEFYVLYHIGNTANQCMKLTDLSKYFNLSQSAMSRMMMRMENSNCGAIERRSCPDDKRGIYIHLTTKGKQKLNKAKIIVDDILKKINEEV